MKAVCRCAKTSPASDRFILSSRAHETNNCVAQISIIVISRLGIIQSLSLLFEERISIWSCSDKGHDVIQHLHFPILDAVWTLWSSFQQTITLFCNICKEVRQVCGCVEKPQSFLFVHLGKSKCHKFRENISEIYSGIWSFQGSS